MWKITGLLSLASIVNSWLTGLLGSTRLFDTAEVPIVGNGEVEGGERWLLMTVGHWRKRSAAL